MTNWNPHGTLDDRGLICGFLLHSQKAPEQLEWDALSNALHSSEGIVWLHFSLVDTRARNWLHSCEFIPAATQTTLSAMNFPNSRARLETVENTIVGLLGDFYHDFNDDPENLGTFLLYLDEKCMITGRRHPLKGTNRLRADVRNGIIIESTLHLLVKLLQHLTEIFSNTIADLNDTVDDIEDRILKRRFPDEGDALGRVRRLLARLRRHIGAQRSALYQAMPRLPSWCSESDIARLEQELARLDGVSQDVELIQERARLLQEELSNQLSEATNRNLYVLSVVTAVFLPITLITGIFGMNVGGLPWTQGEAGFWWVLLVMTITLAVSVFMIRQQRFY